MGYRGSWEKAYSPYWSLHVEAWRRSGLSRAEYCGRHGLKLKTFARWMKHLIGAEEARKHTDELRELRRKEKGRQGKESPRPTHRFGARTDTRSRAIQAFWAMHVEALNWSGMSTGEYARALLLSPWALRKWRARFDDGGVAIDRRAHLHPSARPRISSGDSSAAKESDGENVLTAPALVDPAHDSCEADPAAAVLQNLLPIPPGAVAVELADGRRVFASAGSDPEAVRQYLSGSICRQYLSAVSRQREEDVRC